MKTALKYIIISLIVIVLYYIVYVLNYSLKYGVTPSQMRTVVSQEVYNDWEKNMLQYLWATKPTATDIEGSTPDQIQWITALRSRTGNLTTELDQLYKDPKYVTEVKNNLRYVAKQTGLSILAKENIKPRVKVILNDFGMDYSDPGTQTEFNRKFQKFTNKL